MLTLGVGFLRRSAAETTSPIGVDVGSRCIKIVQLTPRPDGSYSVKAVIRRRPNGGDGLDDSVVPLVREMLRAGSFVGARAVASLPDAFIKYRSLRVAPVAGRELASAVHEQLADRLGSPADQIKTQFVDAGDVWVDDQMRKEVIAMAAPLDELSGYLRLLDRSGLAPDAFDAAPAAVARSVAGEPRHDDSDGERVIIDVGYGSTTITIVRLDQLRFVRRVGIGLGAIDDRAARRLGVGVDEAEGMRDALAREGDRLAWPFACQPRDAEQVLGSAAAAVAERLARDVATSLRYFSVTFRERQPATGVIVGGGSSVQALVDTLSRETRLALRPIDAERWADATDGGAPPGVWAAAVGLCEYDVAATPVGREAA